MVKTLTTDNYFKSLDEIDKISITDKFPNRKSLEESAKKLRKEFLESKFSRYGAFDFPEFEKKGYGDCVSKF